MDEREVRSRIMMAGGRGEDTAIAPTPRSSRISYPGTARGDDGDDIVKIIATSERHRYVRERCETR